MDLEQVLGFLYPSNQVMPLAGLPVQGLRDKTLRLLIRVLGLLLLEEHPQPMQYLNLEHYRQDQRQRQVIAPAAP